MDLLERFEERFVEIDDYFLFVEKVFTQRGQRAADRASNNQLHILFSTVYLLLYNLIEATMNECLEEVVNSIIEDQVMPQELNDGLQKTWLKSQLKPHAGPEKVLSAAQQMLTDLTNNHHCEVFELKALLKSGNWDAKKIERASKSIANTYVNIQEMEMRLVNNRKQPLKRIQEIRNHLSHGSKSFSECGESVTVSDLVDLKTRTKEILRAVIQSYITYINNQGYKSQLSTAETT